MTATPALKTPSNPGQLLELARTYGTPLYVYREETIRRRIRGLKRHLTGLPYHLSYACKANSALPILRIMVEEGLGIDAVSPAELELAIRIGFDPDRILYSSNNMTDGEMTVAHERGALLNIGELSRLERYGRAFPGSDVCVRLNPRVGAGHHDHVITAGPSSKFGIDVGRIDEVRETVHRYGLRLVGLHQHIGSGILDTDILREAAAVMLECAAAIDTLEFVNLGGGLGVPYRPDEAPLDLHSWQDKIVRPLADYVRKHPARNLFVAFEPGRFLVAESGALIVRANTVKASMGRVFAGVDSGMGHLVRPAIYGAYHAIYNLSNPQGELRRYDVVGNICESADFFARDREVQEIREGDWLCVLDTGAYGMSMASEYNLRPLPAEVWIPSSGESPQLLRRSESPGELIDRLYPDLLPR
jgi:diaminopimelate decarboxylase